MPDVPGPDTLPSEEEMQGEIIAAMPEPMRTYYERERPIEMRPVEIQRYMSKDPMAPIFHVWIRATGRSAGRSGDSSGGARLRVRHDAPRHLADAARPTVFDKAIQAASLDHALWFHRPFRADEWLLYAQDTPNASGARGFSRGSIFKQDGTLVASVAQEGLVRDRG